MLMGLEIEESKFRELIKIDPSHDTINITNSSGTEVDSIALTEHMSKVEGASNIETLCIWPSSQLTDLNVIKAFPNLRNIRVYGYQIKSLDGLEWFQQGDFINICTETNRQRRIDKISRTHITRMSLHYARPEDLDDIAECLTLNSLELFRSQDLDFAKWRRLNLETILLKQGKFKEIANTVDIPCLKGIYVFGCRSLERFTGDNSRITRLLIDNCKKLNLQTIQTFKGIKVLTVNSCPNEIALTEIGQLEHLESIDLINCNVIVNTLTLNHHFPKIKELHISNMKKEQAIELSQANPDVLITTKTYKSQHDGQA